MVELEYTKDLKSFGCNGHAGSTPATRTRFKGAMLQLADRGVLETLGCNVHASSNLASPTRYLKHINLLI